ncbi:Ribonuclease H [Quillaja saponaria]|uniref:Ribonuclease H n=1 Tax=Quillaja saponaria TaxID=32244 RepID=A0AAD7VDT7_QUISA|nr:Ribonuclease H [Quillaja saponaria]
MNCDGASWGNLGLSSASCVLRDDNGKWLYGYGRKIGWCNPFWAELWALFLGLKIVWVRRIRKLVVEVNPQAVVEVCC